MGMSKISKHNFKRPTKVTQIQLYSIVVYNWFLEENHINQRTISDSQRRASSSHAFSLSLGNFISNIYIYIYKMCVINNIQTSYFTLEGIYIENDSQSKLPFSQNALCQSNRKAIMRPVVVVKVYHWDANIYCFASLFQN